MLTPIEDTGWLFTEEGRCYVVKRRQVSFPLETSNSMITVWAKEQLVLSGGQESSFAVVESDGVKILHMRNAIDSGD